MQRIELDGFFHRCAHTRNMCEGLVRARTRRVAPFESRAERIGLNEPGGFEKRGVHDGIYLEAGLVPSAEYVTTACQNRSDSIGNAHIDGHATEWWRQACDERNPALRCVPGARFTRQPIPFIISRTSGPEWFDFLPVADM
jgi:hypothetical protein